MSTVPPSDNPASPDFEDRPGLTKATVKSTGPLESTGNLLSEAMSSVSNLVREELNLAKAELNENLTRAGVAVGLLVGAVVVALVTLHLLAAALVAAVTELGLDAGWAALLVGVILAIVAFIMAKKGINDLKASRLAPTRTVKNVKRDAQTVKDATNV